MTILLIFKPFAQGKVVLFITPEYFKFDNTACIIKSSRKVSIQKEVI